MGSASTGPGDVDPRTTVLPEQPELVVVLAPGSWATGGRRRAFLSADEPGTTGAAAEPAPSEVLDLLADVAPGLRLHSVFGRSRAAEQPPGAEETDEAPRDDYVLVEGLTDGHEELAERLRGLDVVLGAYVKPPATPAVVLNEMAPAAEEPPARTPDFSDRQGYLGPPPRGIGARWAHTQPGGRGSGVHVIDVEGSWRLTHEDLLQQAGGVIGGIPTGSLGWRNHGTAVIGVIGSDPNGFGTLGIAPDAFVRAVSFFGEGWGTATAIRRAADALTPGDILLLEVQRRGPEGAAFGQDGYIAIEWWPDDFDAIAYAVARGVIVVEAAGNGSVDLDDDLYDTPLVGFPPRWRNPLGRNGRDSGAILVGAGAPPPGTHGQNWGPDRSRLDFSNHGSRVDVQGWGREVTTCGYGELQGGPDEDLWYTDRFSGTSSASPIVVGALACVQGMLRAAGDAALTPAGARRCLRETGSPQQRSGEAPLSERIGTRPDIAALLARVRETGTGGGEEDKKDKEDEKEGGGPRKFPKLEKNEFKDAVDKSGEGAPPAPEPAIEDRVQALEAEVERLRHFIGPELRPDLTAAARATTPAGSEGGDADAHDTAPDEAGEKPTAAAKPAPAKRAAAKRTPSRSRGRSAPP